MKRAQVSVYTVAQVNSYIRSMFSEDPFLSRIYVKGEISNCKYHSTGHIYFSLKDERAQISCIMFAGDRKNLNFRLEDGQKVIVFGKVGVYEKGGSYQLYASAVRLDGIGALYERFEALKKELAEMGMFDPMYKKPIPHYIRRLGVVTAPTGAAVRDIINVSKRRNPGIEIILYPARVQGEGAAQSIVRGIQLLDGAGADTIIVGRGGGSIEDLWAFNERIVAEAIFNARTPVISAVGHETDFTIADYVADLRAPTPSAGAELAVDDMVAVRESLKQLSLRQDQLLLGKVRYQRKTLEGYRIRLQARGPMMRIREKSMQLDHMGELMTSAMHRKRDEALARLKDCRAMLKIDAKVSEARGKAELIRPRLSASMRQKIQDSRRRYEVLRARTEALSPQDHLRRGYAYVTDEEGRAVRSVSQVRAGDLMNVTLKDGTVKTEVR